MSAVADTRDPYFSVVWNTRVTPEMLSAGRAAFMENRATLSDLYEFFDSDLTVFLLAVYGSMATVGCKAAAIQQAGGVLSFSDHTLAMGASDATGK